MLNWLQNIISNLRSKRITDRKIKEAYVLKDNAYLKKAYRNVRAYLKPQIVCLIGEISNQKNFDFLLHELKTVEDLQLKSYIFLALTNIAYSSNFEIKKKDLQYLNQNMSLLENIEFVDYEILVSEGAPILFREQLQDHLGVLEEMKRRNAGFLGC